MRSLGILARGNSISAIDKGHQVTGVAYLALICPSVAVCLRIYVRLGIQKRMGNDDYLAIASLFVLSALCALLIRSCLHFGLGSHLISLSPSALAQLSHTNYACEILYILTTALTKLSIGFYFLRLTQKQYQRQIIFAVMFIVTFVSTVYLLFTIFQCQPVHYLWRQHEKPTESGSCQSINAIANITYAHASMSCVSDWMFGTLPILFLWKLDMKIKTKISILIILSLSIVASIATIFRMVHIHSLKSMTDFTWEGIGLIKWSLIEPAIALTAATLATLRPLTQKLFSSKKIPPKLSIKTRHGLTRKSSVCHSSEFAEMLGLAVSPGVRTQVYADSTVETPIPHSPLWSGWRDNQKGLWSPLRSPRHDGEERTFSLGLKTLKNGSWVFKNDAGGGIMRTIVVTRNVGS